MTLAGCGGKKAPARADYAIHLYNSLDLPITVEYPGETLGEGFTTEQRASVEGPQRISLSPRQSDTVFVTQARAVPFRVVEPAGQESLSQTVEVLPLERGKRDVLLDFGGRGVFFKHPVFYVPMQQMYRPLASDVASRYPTTSLGPATARHELDQRFDGVNRTPPRQVTTSEPGGAVVTLLVDQAGLDRVRRGLSLDAR